MNIEIQTCMRAEGLTESFKSFIRSWEYWTLDELLSALKTGNYTLFFARDGEKTVAALLTLRSGEFIDVIYLYTDVNYRRKNLALNLLEECEREMRWLGTEKRIFLEVRRDNTPAQKLYEAFGMKRQGVRTKYYKDGCDAFVYCKEMGTDAP